MFTAVAGRTRPWPAIRGNSPHLNLRGTAHSLRNLDGGLVELQRAEIDECKASNELAWLIVPEPDQPAFGGAGFLTDWSQREPDGLIPGWGDIGLDGDPSTAEVLHLAGHRDGIPLAARNETFP